MKKIPIILLAAGQSSRMGDADKLMQLVEDIPLMRRSAMTALAAAPVYAALPPAPHPRYRALDGLDVQKVEIPDAAEGMNASLRGALKHIPADARAVMVLLADLPELTTSDLQCVSASVAANPDNLVWRGATETGKPGHPVIFDRSLFDQLSNLKGDTGAQSVVRQHADKVHLQRLPADRALLDLDTPEDWASWLTQRKSQT